MLPPVTHLGTPHRRGVSTLKSGPAWFFVALTGFMTLAVLKWVDLAPRVERDFFFSPNDPQLQASEELSRRFPSPDQIIIRAGAPDIQSASYRSSIRDLTTALGNIEGVTGVNSITTDDASRSPLWGRLLLNPNGESTNIIVQIDDTEPSTLVRNIEAVVEPLNNSDFDLKVSGVPFIIELIRRSLLRDLALFSAAALLLFGLLVAGIYRNKHIVLGTLTTCLLACVTTLAVTDILEIRIGLLTANIAVIVFVVTLSHIVFLTSNWKRANIDPGNQRNDAARNAVKVTFPSSFWCMVTTALGFLSLLVASARPLRELGTAGAIGTVTAILLAYTIYPAFLRSASATTPLTVGGTRRTPRLRLPQRRPRVWLGGIAFAVFAAVLGFRQLTSDPSLLSYFAPGTELRDGLDAIDRDGGSSPLNIVVRDSDGASLDSDEANDKMWQLQDALENDSSVGVVLSPVVLLAHAKLAPFAGFLNWGALLDILESPLLGRIGLSFVTGDRSEGRYFLRMKESGRVEPRAEVIARIRDHVRESGLQPTLVGGQYDLQEKLGRLIASSLRIGLGGLVLAFVGIAFIVSRSVRGTIAMVLCLTAIPLVVLGLMGHLNMPIDIIVSPAANVALAMGVDSMIHLVLRVRRLSANSSSVWDTWLEARSQLWQPILGAALIICAGFGIFGLSSFPPTQRFGFAVIVGTLTAALMALVALPFGAGAKLAGR